MAADALTAEIIGHVSDHFAGLSTAGDFVAIARVLKDRAEASLRALARLERQLLPPRQNPKALYWATALGLLSLPAGFIPVAGPFIGLGLGVAAVAVGGKDVPETMARSGLRKRLVASLTALGAALHHLAFMVRVAAAGRGLPPPA